MQVAVKGKYGPVFIGKTWFGKYDEKAEFTALKKAVIAWYFIDYNGDALKEQRENHWDGAEEELLDPVPHVDN